MATTYTPLLGLAKHATTDPFDVTLLNDNANTLDTAMGKAYRGKAVHNLLDNSDFRNPVNQRGVTVYKGSTYALDRWFFYSGDAEGSKVYLRDDNIGIIGGSVVASLSQRISKGILDSNKRYTLAYYDNINDKLYIDNNPVVYETTRNYDRVYIPVQAGKSLLIQWAALYEGTYTADTLPEYVPKGYAAELAECQRYYYQTWDGAKPTSGAVLPGLETKAAISGVRLAMVKFPVTMRIAPSITLYTSDFVSGGVRNWNTSSDEVTGVTAVYQGTKGFMPSKSSNSFTAGQIYSFHYSASADI